MRRAVACLGFVALAFGAQLPNLVSGIKESEKSTWIVVFNDNISQSAIADHHERFQHDVQFHYETGDFRGYAAPMNASTIKLVSQSEEVSFVEADQMMYATQSCGRQSGATWGLDRINEKAINLDGSYTYSSTGAGVRSYVVDTGIYLAHKDFEGRAVFGANYAGDGQQNDCNGHGTHVAGTVGATTWGVAKKTTLVAVKVLGCDGSGTNAGVIAGVTFVGTDAKAKKSKAVANMSLGGGYSAALNKAVASVVAQGITFVVAAGNENQDACNTSPASEPLAITVGATTVANSGMSTQKDQRASFSNFGKCLDIFAPGQLITAPWIGSTTALETISGTSMASPHVAGAAALLLSANNNLTPAQIASSLTSSANSGMITMSCTTSTTACNSSPNKLLYTSSC